jgi:hypothetical protein
MRPIEIASATLWQLIVPNVFCKSAKTRTNLYIRKMQQKKTTQRVTSHAFLGRRIGRTDGQSLYTKDATKEGHTACHVTRFSRSLDRPDGWPDLASLSHFKEKPLSCTNSTRSPWPFSLNFADKPSEFSKIAKQSRPTTLPTRAWLGLNEPNSAKL